MCVWMRGEWCHSIDKNELLRVFILRYSTDLCSRHLAPIRSADAWMRDNRIRRAHTVNGSNVTVSCASNRHTWPLHWFRGFVIKFAVNSKLRRRFALISRLVRSHVCLCVRIALINCMYIAQQRNANNAGAHGTPFTVSMPFYVIFVFKLPASFFEFHSTARLALLFLIFQSVRCATSRSFLQLKKCVRDIMWLYLNSMVLAQFKCVSKYNV